MINRTRPTHWRELYLHYTSNLLGLVDALVCFGTLGLLISDLKSEFMASDHVWKQCQKF